MSVDYTALIDRDYESIAFELLAIVREPLVWTGKIPERNVGGYGVQEHEWYAIKDVRDPMIGMDAIEYDFDQALVTPTRQKIPVFWKDIDINPRELASAQRGPIESLPLRTQKAEMAKLKDRVERAIAFGIDFPEAITSVNESLTDTGNSAGAWSTVANIETDTKKNYATLMGNSQYGPYYTIHYSDLAGDLQSLIGTTSAIYEDYVNRLAKLGTSYTNYQCLADGTPCTTTGTQTMIQPVSEGQNNIELLVAENWRTHDASAAKGNFGLRMKIYGAMIHEVYRATAGAFIDAITP